MDSIFKAIFSPVEAQNIIDYLAPAHLEAFIPGLITGFALGAGLVWAIYYQAGVRFVRSKPPNG